MAEFLNPEAARLLCGRLQAEDIEARIFPEEFFSFYGHGVMWLGQPIQVLVPQERVQEAKDIIRSIEKG